MKTIIITCISFAFVINTIVMCMFIGISTDLRELVKEKEFEINELNKSINEIENDCSTIESDYIFEL